MNEIGDDMIQLPTTIGREERLKAAECRRMAGETKLYRKGRRSEWKCRWLFWEGGLEAIISSRQTAAQKLLVCKTIWYYMYWDANEMSCYHHQLASDCPESCRTNCQIEIWSPKHHWKSNKRPCPWFIAASSVKVAAKRHKNLIQVAVRGLTRCSPSSLAKQPLGGHEEKVEPAPHVSQVSQVSCQDFLGIGHMGNSKSSHCNSQLQPVESRHLMNCWQPFSHHLLTRIRLKFQSKDHPSSPPKQQCHHLGFGRRLLR